MILRGLTKRIGYRLTSCGSLSGTRRYRARFLPRWAGTPARPARQTLREVAALRRLPELVASIGQATRSARPGLVVSAAVISYVDRAYLSLAQDWPRWLEEGLIDLAIPMAYTLDDRLLGYQLDHFGNAATRDRIWPGLGVWLFARSPERALGQIAIARRSGLPGEVLFSYDSIADAPELEEALAASSDPGPDAP